MHPSRTLQKIGIWGHYHGVNEGDEIVVATLIQNLRARRPTIQIVGFSQNPASTRARYGIPSFPISQKALNRPERESEAAFNRPERESNAERPHRSIRSSLKGILNHIPWLKASLIRLLRLMYAARTSLREVRFLWTSSRYLQDVDLLIVAGSGQLYDGAGTWKHPYNLFKWTLLARITGTQCAYLCVGAGPIDTLLSRFFLRTALRFVTYCSYRDQSSADLLEQLGVKRRHPVLPDLAFSFHVSDTHTHEGFPSALSSRPIIGLSTMAYQDPRYWPHGNRQAYEVYLRKLAAFTEWLILHDHTVMLLYSNTIADVRVGADLKEILAQHSNGDLIERVIDQPPASFNQLLDQIAVCESVVATRFHCHVLPFLLHKPVLGLAYHPKTFDLMAYMKQENYCLNIDEFNVPGLIGCFRQLQTNRDAVEAQIAERVYACRQSLNNQYDRLFGLQGQMSSPENQAE